MMRRRGKSPRCSRKRDPRVVATIARGSSDHAALYLKYLIEIALGVPCASIGPSIASLYDAPLRLEGALAITISQSGRSPDIVALQDAANRAGALTLALVNDVDSPAARGARMFAAAACRPRAIGRGDQIDDRRRSSPAPRSSRQWVGDEALSAAISRLPALLSGAAAPPPPALVDLVAGAKSAFVLGRGATFAIAAEAALKLKETCAIHAEAFSSAEVLHGPAGVITPGFLVIAFMPQDAAREGMGETLGASCRHGRQCRRRRRRGWRQTNPRLSCRPPIIRC